MDILERGFTSMGIKRDLEFIKNELLVGFSGSMVKKVYKKSINQRNYNGKVTVDSKQLIINNGNINKVNNA